MEIQKNSPSNLSSGTNVQLDQSDRRRDELKKRGVHDISESFGALCNAMNNTEFDAGNDAMAVNRYCRL